MVMKMSPCNVTTLSVLVPHNETPTVISSSVCDVEHFGVLAHCRHNKKSPQATEVLR